MAIDWMNPSDDAIEARRIGINTARKVCLELIEEMDAEIKQLRIELAEWKHRTVGGTCQVLSKGDACDCSLCKRDAEIKRLQAIIANLHHDALRYRVGGKEADRLKAGVERLEGLLAVIHGDGGHHTAEVGLERSVEDAQDKWVKLVEAAEGNCD